MIENKDNQMKKYYKKEGFWTKENNNNLIKIIHIMMMKLEE